MSHAPDSPLAARFLASPNRGQRRGRGRPDCVILHYTGMATGEAALAPSDPASEVSCHYFVWEDGKDRPARRRGPAHLARRRGFWKGEPRPELRFDRNRDRQSRP